MNQPSSIKKKLLVKNKLGLHARASAKIVQMANQYQAEVWIQKDEQKVNAKSIMGLLTLAAGQGSEVLLEVVGEDAEEVSESLEKLFAEKFGEE